MTSSINTILRKKCFILIYDKICIALDYTIVQKFGVGKTFKSLILIKAAFKNAVKQFCHDNSRRIWHGMLICLVLEK